MPLRSCSTGLVLALVLLPGFGTVRAQDQPQAAPPQDTPSPSPAPAAPGPSSKLNGRVAGSDGTATAGATVLAYHLSTEQLFRSTPTDPQGKFAFDAVPYGYFDLAVLAADGLYVADAVVNVPPAGKASVSLTLTPGATAEALRTFPGTDQQPVGIAGVNRNDGKGFWGSAAGIAILAGGGAVALALLASGGDDSTPSSPSAP